MQPDLFSVIVWGQIDETDAAELSAILTAQEQADLKPHAVLVQFQRIERADELSVRRMAAFMDQHREAQARLVHKEALIRPAGSVGMMVAGFYDVVRQHFPSRVFTDVNEGLTWLGFGEQAANWLPEWQQLVDEQTAEAGSVRALRELLATRHATLTITSAAEALHISERTLQRRLQEAGLSFRNELTEARVSAAQNLLLTTDLDIKAVALQVGAASPQSFSQLFREQTGETPTQWRKRQHALKR